MPIRSYNPTTPGLRGMTRLTYEEITKSTPEKRLTSIKKHKSGRNNQGRLTVRHNGGGNKIRYRMVDFSRIEKVGIPGKVAAVEYDPNRTAFIMLVNYADGEKRYHLCPDGLQVGTEILTKSKCKIKPGNRIHLKNIPIGYPIFEIEMEPGKGGQIARSAGTAARLVSLEGAKAQIEMSSGEIRLIEKKCYATIGTVSNLDNFNVKIGKAGRNRWVRRRPKVLGKSMNPVDHPHGGGEGHTSIGLIHPKTPWGKPALGFKTRRRKYTDKFIVRSRHSKKKSN